VEAGVRITTCSTLMLLVGSASGISTNRVLSVEGFDYSVSVCYVSVRII
jgi:hypothetical protein